MICNPYLKENLLMLDDFRIREFTEMEARMLNPLQLALIGDGVYEVFIRNYIYWSILG